MTGNPPSTRQNTIATNPISALTGASGRWEQYARATFLAHTKNVSPKKLRYLQYLAPGTEDWWMPKRKKGAVLLGSMAEKLGLTFSEPSA